MRALPLLLLTAGLLGVAGCSEAVSNGPATADGWTPAQLELLRSLSLASLGDPPLQGSNRVAADRRAARLGRRLFFDPALSRNGEVACASCHRPELYFTDGQAVSRGLGPTTRNAPTVVGAAYSPWQYWDGRRDSLWAQALAPLEAASEMGSDRYRVVAYVTQSTLHREDYRELFGALPDLAEMGVFKHGSGPHGSPEAREAWSRLPQDHREQIDRAFSNVGKAIAAYERLLVPAPARFDAYVESLLARDTAAAETRRLGDDETAGLRLFLDPARTQCLRCHNGPLFTNHSFHDVATSRLGALPDLGRFLGIQSLLLDPFNCLGPYSDASPDACRELRFLPRRELALESGAFKTPTLREVERTAPYLHDGSVADLAGVMEHYRAPPNDPGSELLPLELDDRELAQLVAFLGTLSGGVAPEPAWLASTDGDGGPHGQK